MWNEQEGDEGTEGRRDEVKVNKLHSSLRPRVP